MNKFSPKKVMNVSIQAESAEEQKKTFKNFLVKNLIKNGFKVEVIQDSTIIVEKEKGEQNEQKYTEDT